MTHTSNAVDTLGDQLETKLAHGFEPVYEHDDCMICGHLISTNKQKENHNTALCRDCAEGSK